MNFLAHCLLSCEDEYVLVGNFMADFVRNREVQALPPAVRRGVILHRHIDRFTDSHPAVKQSTQRLQPYHRKYAPVVVDVFYDYLLANYWHRYSMESLRAFAERQYYLLDKHRHLMPPRLQRRTAGMIAGDWLVQYGSWSGLTFTFGKLEQRLSKPEQLADVIAHLRQHEAALTADFHQFFPQLVAYVKRRCLSLSDGPTQQLSEEE